MTVYKGSRLIGLQVLYDDTNECNYLQFPEDKFSEKLTDYKVQFTQGARVDLLASEYYGDAQLDWVIMQANPQYNTPEEIEIGDFIVIPSPERVLPYA